mmetsp:Transcript_37165/g.76184  ORF Transcript_37165/g.76184 Transcript_37165/m.76184 type:complete len:118 (+) Transcript_37165:97-450(+)
MASAINPFDPDQLHIFTLSHPGSCTGMFWRDDPRPDAKQEIDKPSWPRNGAFLKGKIHQIGNMKYLECVEYVQANSKQWEYTPGCWMPFYQGGLLLHEGMLEGIAAPPVCSGSCAIL